MTPSRTLFELAGSPAQEGCEPLPVEHGCRVCGVPFSCRGIVYHRWQGSTFTDQNKLKDWSAETVCEACVWAHAWNVPPGFPPPEDGKKGVNLRLYSHFWHDGEYHAWNKANKREIREWLRTSKSGPWFAAIADTGQKHVLPWTPMNFGGPGDLPARGVVRFEEQNVRLGNFALIDAMCELLTAGATKEEIETGQYTPRAWQLARKTLEAFEDDHGRRGRGGAWFSLALWLAQRDEEQVAERLAAEKETKAAKAEKAKEQKRADTGAKRKPTRSDGRSAARPEGGIPDGGSLSSQALGPAAGPPTKRGEAKRDEQRVGNGDDAKPRAEQPKCQLGLFD